MFNKPILERLLIVLSHKLGKLLIYSYYKQKLAWKSQIFAEY